MSYPFLVRQQERSAWHRPGCHACELDAGLFGNPFSPFSVKTRQPWHYAYGACHGDTFLAPPERAAGRFINIPETFSVRTSQLWHDKRVPRGTDEGYHGSQVLTEKGRRGLS
jgi:hypothetical protein